MKPLQLRLAARVPVDKEVDAVWNAIKDSPRGELLLYTRLEQLVGVKKDVYPWAKIIAKVRKRLRDERKISLIAEYSIGFRLASVNEQVEEMLDAEKSVQRRIKKTAVLATVLLASNELDVAQTEGVATVLSDVQKLHEVRSVQVVQRKSLFATPPVNPSALSHQ